MANKLTPDGGAVAGANVANRAATIATGFAELNRLDAQIATLKATHLKPVMDARKKVARALKKDVDMPMADLNPQYAVYKRAHAARDMIDEHQRDTVLDNLKEIHQALHPGSTVDWVALVMGEPQPEAK